jgi:hypothetical protein
VKLITGHDLRTGLVLYRTQSGSWSETIADAAIFEDDASEAALAEAKSEPTRVTNVYLVEADGPGRPSHRVAMRENIRARGPTVRLDLGKQAEGQS